jgi:hypothetical protein
MIESFETEVPMAASEAPSPNAASSETREPTPTLEIWGVKVPLPRWAVNVVAPIAILAFLVVGFIHLRQDASEKAQRQQQLDQLTQENGKLEAQLAERYTISGVVEAKSGSVNGLPVYAALSGASLGEDGKFRFENMLNSGYSIVLVGQDKNLLLFGIDPDSTETEGAGFTITYKYDKE